MLAGGLLLCNACSNEPFFHFGYIIILAATGFFHFQTLPSTLFRASRYACWVMNVLHFFVGK